MSTKPKADPTLPFTTITIGEREYKMCFDFEAIAEAEAAIRAQGHDVHLVLAPWQSDMKTVRDLFAASLRLYQPEVSFAEARKLVGWGNVLEVVAAVQAAREEYLPKADEDKKPADPQDAPAS